MRTFPRLLSPIVPRYERGMCPLLAAVSARIADINTNIKNMEAHTDEDRRARIDRTSPVDGAIEVVFGDPHHANGEPLFDEGPHGRERLDPQPERLTHRARVPLPRVLVLPRRQP